MKKNLMILTLVPFVMVAIVGYLIKTPLSIISAKPWFLVALYLALVAVMYLIAALIDYDFEDKISPKAYKIYGGVIILFSILWIVIMVTSNWMGHTDKVITPTEISSEFIPSVEVTGSTDIYPNSRMLQASADKTMGSNVDLATEYDVKSTQIQLRDGAPVAITTVQHGSIWKALGTNEINNYLVTNPIPEGNIINTEAVSADVQYDTSNVFGNDSRRAVQMQFPFLVFGDSHDEIDDNGKLWEIFPVMTRIFGVFGPEDYQKVVVLDKATGEAILYNNSDVPEFIDCLVPAENIIKKFNAWGKYKGGFMNGMFAKKGCLTTSVDKTDAQDWGYLVKDSVLYIYTGVTSMTQAESNIGYLFGNLRTGEMFYLPVSGTVTEFSAMKSVETEVNEKMWDAAFPTLHVLNGEKVYVMVLHDSAYTLKRYAVISAQNVENLYIADTLVAALNGYSGKTGVATASEVADVTDECHEIHVESLTYHEGYMEIITKEGEIYRLYA